MNTKPKRKPLVKTFTACTYSRTGLKVGPLAAWRNYKISVLMFYGRGRMKVVVMGLN